MDKVFIINGASGSWEDARSWIVGVYEDEQMANDTLFGLNEKLKCDKVKNKLNHKACNECDKNDEVCDSYEYIDPCDGCEFEYDYNLEDQHSYMLETCDFIGKEMS